MGYRNAGEILPVEIIELIQQYVDGENIYIPRRSENRLKWGSRTEITRELSHRNKLIYADFSEGMSTLELADKYCLSHKSIQRIIRDMKS
ncbi:MAG: hypothetical protein HDR02_00715 [Lachnospiraceae bacterium]|nr:hypothetical protein [Lachnospiraceae bacterium]